MTLNEITQGPLNPQNQMPLKIAGSSLQTIASTACPPYAPRSSTGEQVRATLRIHHVDEEESVFKQKIKLHFSNYQKFLFCHYTVLKFSLTVKVNHQYQNNNLVKKFKFTYLRKKSFSIVKQGSIAKKCIVLIKIYLILYNSL